MSAAILATLTLSAAAGDSEDVYSYKDTRDLVALVEDAALLLETKGNAAFAEFDKIGSRWLNGETYMFVYAADGTSVYHPISKELVGTNVIDLKDVDGKPIVQEMVDIAKSPEPDASGWIFYHWQDQKQLKPVWKSSYVRKAIMPDGKTYIVGSGLYSIKTERRFVEERVNAAHDLLLSAGKEAAFARFKDSASPFIYLGNYIFVLNEKGDALVDPAFPTRSGRSMLNFTDAVGMHPIQELMNKLKNTDRAWVQFLLPQPGAVLPSRKLMYARKVHLGDETLIVGSEFFVPTPIWMRVERAPSWSKNQQG